MALDKRKSGKKRFRKPYGKRKVQSEIVSARKRFRHQLSEWLTLHDLEGMAETLKKAGYPYCIIENHHGEFALFTEGKMLKKEKRRKASLVQVAA